MILYWKLVNFNKKPHLPPPLVYLAKALIYVKKYFLNKNNRPVVQLLQI